jgi:hypothetical protein
MEIIREIEALNNGTFPCDIVLNFADKCPGSTRPEEILCDSIKEAARALFELLPSKDFPTCMESFECFPDFFADICPQHIDCPEDVEPERFDILAE